MRGLFWAISGKSSSTGWVDPSSHLTPNRAKHKPARQPTLGISVIGMGHAAKSLLPRRVPDLQRNSPDENQGRNPTGSPFIPRAQIPGERWHRGIRECSKPRAQNQCKDVEMEALRNPLLVYSAPYIGDFQVTQTSMK